MRPAPNLVLAKSDLVSAYAWSEHCRKMHPGSPGTTQAADDFLQCAPEQAEARGSCTEAMPAACRATEEWEMDRFSLWA